MTEKAVATKWKGSMSFITKLKRKVRETGSIEPIKPKTGPTPKLEPHYELLRKIVTETSNATLAEIQDLLPTLRKGDIVVIDNLPGHVDGRVKLLIESKGMKVLYLPAYSPDLNPIELPFSKLKSVLRKEKIRDVPTLQKFLLESGQLFTKKNAKTIANTMDTQYTNVRNALAEAQRGTPATLWPPAVL